MTAQPLAKTSPTLRCSFCGKSNLEVESLVAGPAVFICDACVALCEKIITALPKTDKPKPIKADWISKLASDQILALLKSQETTYEDVSARVRHSVDILRGRKVSWEAIGKSLGVSRQAAWERFS
jgi:hypothetical protein